MGVEPKIGLPNTPNHHFYRVFHYFHHPFWVVFPLIFGFFHPSSTPMVGEPSESNTSPTSKTSCKIRCKEPFSYAPAMGI